MNKEMLFKKYKIDSTHAVWEPIDSWNSVEIYKEMHMGKLPPKDDQTIGWLVGWLNLVISKNAAGSRIKKRPDFGTLFLTAKRMVYHFHSHIIYYELSKNKY